MCGTIRLALAMTSLASCLCHFCRTRVSTVECPNIAEALRGCSRTCSIYEYLNWRHASCGALWCPAEAYQARRHHLRKHRRHLERSRMCVTLGSLFRSWPDLHIWQGSYTIILYGFHRVSGFTKRSSTCFHAWVAFAFIQRILWGKLHQDQHPRMSRCQ